MHSLTKLLDDELKSRLQDRRDEGLYRKRYLLEGPQMVTPVIQGRSYISFCSNDYLGLANHPEIVRAFKHAADKFGVGSGASHLVVGHSYHHHCLEEELADFVGRERALLFSTGYMANLGVVSALLGRNDILFEDRLNHASLVDAGILSRARLRRYRHGDHRSLEEQLDVSKSGRKLVLTDGVFSMDGDMAPLRELVGCTVKCGGWLMVDDAHGLGVVGATGRGVIEQQCIDVRDVPILIGTLGKAFGTFGAFAAGSESLIETLIQNARSYIYTTALPPAVAAATRASLKIVREEHWRRQHLQALIQRFQRGLVECNLPVPSSTNPIQPIVLGDSKKTLDASNALRKRGIFVTPIRPPTVPNGTARLRITFSAAHTPAHVDLLIESLEATIR